MIQVLQPAYLFLLLLIPLIWYTAKDVRVLGYGRKTLALILRTLVLVLIILSLAEIELSDQGEHLTVFFAIDRSSSIPSDEQEFGLSYVQQQLGLLPEGDEARILFFGKDAAIQDRPGENVDLRDYQPMINTEGTDIEGAIGLAMAAFPQGTQRRIVLITDGNQTQGDAVSAIRRARANGVDVMILPQRYVYAQEVLVEDVVLPSRIREDEPFSLRVMVRAQEAGPGTLRIFENGEVILEQAVDLAAGKNAYTLSREISQAGVYTYEAQIEAENDRRPSNNRAQNFAVVRGQPRVLLLETEPAEGENLAVALQNEGILVDYAEPEAAPVTLRDYQAYESVILSNVPASRMDQVQQRAIESAVRDLGMGLLMIGGPDSFGAGGWQNTPVENALPLDMEIKQRRVIPSGALVLIMHSTEMPQGNYWAQQVSEEAIRVLSRNDYAGFLRYSNQFGESWLFELERLGNKRRQLSLIRNLAFQDIGDMPSFDPTMQMAYDSLMRTQTNVKHMVILSDGDPARPNPTLVENIKSARITVSTVCVNPHNASDVTTMEELADYLGGTAYYIKNSQDLPQIFIKEATVVRRNTIVEEPFTPGIVQVNELITGFDAFPQLQGYVLATPKSKAEQILATHKGDPLLASWRYGLGKSAAFTSDAKSRWAPDWLGWDQYAQFWGQVVRWTLRTEQENNFQVQTSIEGDQVRIAVDALNQEGEFLNELDFQAVAIDPELESATVALRQTQPGRYEGAFRAADPGNYMVKMNYEDSEGEIEGQLTSGVAVPYSPEHSTTTQNDVMLKRMADETGHPLIDVETHIFEHNLLATADVMPLWPWFLSLAAIFFFIDVAVRRVFFEMPALQAAFARVWGWVMYPFTRKPPAPRPSEQMDSLRQAKERAQGAQTAETKDEFLQRLESAKDESLGDLPAAQDSDAPGQEAKGEKDLPQFDDEEEDSYTSALKRAKQRASKNYQDPNKPNQQDNG